ncbi:N-acetylneuraminate lyase, partial [Streptococcus suis]
IRINDGLDIGSVREPLTALTEADLSIAQEAAQLIRDAKERFGA